MARVLPAPHVNKGCSHAPAQCPLLLRKGPPNPEGRALHSAATPQYPGGCLSRVLGSHLRHKHVLARLLRHFAVLQLLTAVSPVTPPMKHDSI